MGQDILDDFMRVPIPNIIPCSLPLWRVNCVGEGTIVPEVCTFPLDIPKFNCVNLLMEISVIDDWWRVTVRNECGSPQFKELVNLSLREFSISKRKLCKLKTSLGCER